MEFVWMKHVGVEQPAKVPASAVPHWEGNGWEHTDPPVKPPRPTFTAPKPAPKTEAAQAAEKKLADPTADTADSTPATKPKPSSRRKED